MAPQGETWSCHGRPSMTAHRSAANNSWRDGSTLVPRRDGYPRPAARDEARDELCVCRWQCPGLPRSEPPALGSDRPCLGPRSDPEALDGTNPLNRMNFLDEMDTTHPSAGHPQTARVRHAARKMIDVRFERSRIASLRGARRTSSAKPTAGTSRWIATMTRSMQKNLDAWPASQDQCFRSSPFASDAL